MNPIEEAARREFTTDNADREKLLESIILALLNAGDSREWRAACERAKAVIAENPCVKPIPKK